MQAAGLEGPCSCNGGPTLEAVLPVGRPKPQAESAAMAQVLNRHGVTTLQPSRAGPRKRMKKPPTPAAGLFGYQGKQCDQRLGAHSGQIDVARLAKVATALSACSPNQARVMHWSACAMWRQTASAKSRSSRRRRRPLPAVPAGKGWAGQESATC